jgi:hypothetical protein
MALAECFRCPVAVSSFVRPSLTLPKRLFDYHVYYFNLAVRYRNELSPFMPWFTRRSLGVVTSLIWRFGGLTYVYIVEYTPSTHNILNIYLLEYKAGVGGFGQMIGDDSDGATLEEQQVRRYLCWFVSLLVCLFVCSFHGGLLLGSSSGVSCESLLLMSVLCMRQRIAVRTQVHACRASQLPHGPQGIALDVACGRRNN